MFTIGLGICLLIVGGGSIPREECKFGIVLPWSREHRGPSVMPILEPDPAGWDNGGSVFLGRSFIQDYYWWKPGSIFVRDDDVSCHVHQYQAFRKEIFQVFDPPRGATSWIPYDHTNFPAATAIVAGWHGDGTPAYACRAWVGDNLYVGNVEVGSSTCWLAIGGEARGAVAVEIMAMNWYGLLKLNYWTEYRCYRLGTH